jgi:hypothetical protein
MGTSAEVRIRVDGKVYSWFYDQDGRCDGIGQQLWVFLARLSNVQWEEMDVRLREQVKWYVNLSYVGVDN